ncbi:MAG TPA: ATP-binding cassette domain-containing protein [Streptosporangiaceae bacterium]|nr:ATP-binding cassette domain-containing protein [Streptosporangiaceae bacterium]
MSAEPAVEAVGVTKSFGTVLALRGVDLTVQPGTLAALLGPNGAGKTTLVRILATLLRQDAGTVRVLGRDVTTSPYAVRSVIGLTGQYAGLDEGLNGRGNLMLIGRLAGLGRREAEARSAELAERFGLAAAIGRSVRTYSGGMRRRLDLAASLMNRPALLILDEPTTGLDPASRLELWSALRELREAGTTMLLTTQYLEEADRFADVVHVLDHGVLIAAGTAAQLKTRAGAQVVDVLLTGQDAAAAAAALHDRFAPADLRVDGASRRLTIVARNGIATLLAAAEALRADGIGVEDIALRQPSLDEAFLSLTAAR